MASISLPHSHSSTLTHFDTPHDSFYQSTHIKLAATSPEPNPPFVFPAAPPSPHRPSSSTTTLKMKDSTSPPPLPAFSFNPGADLPPEDAKPKVPPPPRPGGHRRRGSEFVADAPKSPGLHSSGPTKAENLAPPPQLPAPGPGFSGPGPGKRRHAHRRSAAISSMDLSAIAKSYPGKPAAESAPSTPADMKQQHAWNEHNSRPLSRSATSLNATTPPQSPDMELKPEPQAKVEFVDNVSVIPRPLSVISSETSSSLSTVRANHSATGSLGSMSGHGMPSNKTMARPKSANPAFSFNENTGFGDNSAQLKRPLSASASASPSTSTNPGSAEPFDMPPKKKHIWENSESNAVSDKPALGSSSAVASTSGEPPLPSGNPPTRAPSSRKTSKKQKKVRSWAGAILTRKGKRRSSSKAVSKRAPTPPPNPPPVAADDDSMSEVDFDEDNTVVLRSPTNPDAPQATLSSSLQTNLPNSSLESSWKPKSFYDQGSELDLSSPVIDLDAALGPFNTPGMRAERPVTSSFSAATKRMYSGGRRGEFIGPEMRYHRRAESAPEMPPFDRSSLAMGRFGSNPTISNPDVFDEEEEDAFLADNPPEADCKAASSETVQASADNVQNRSSRRDSSATVIAQSMDVQNDANDTAGLGIQVVDSADSYRSNSSETSDRAIMSQQGMQQGAGTQYTDNPAQQAGAQAPMSQESVEILDGDDLPSPMGKPTSTTSSPRSTGRFLHIEKRPASSPVDFAYTAPQMPPPMSESSGFPSPDPSHLSFEASHLTTASSSMTDHQPSNYSTRYHGSVDDVPSLTSSTSTTTNSMPRFSGSFFVRSSGDRAASFSAPVPRRTSQANASKRSSLASLSKLVGGSHGERSKLSHEEKAPGDECERTKKKSHHRLSRLMQFWKTKEKEKNQAKDNMV